MPNYYLWKSRKN